MLTFYDIIKIDDEGVLQRQLYYRGAKPVGQEKIIDGAQVLTSFQVQSLGRLVAKDCGGAVLGTVAAGQ